MLVTGILSFSYNVFYLYKDKNKKFRNRYYVTCFQFGPVENFCHLVKSYCNINLSFDFNDRLMIDWMVFNAVFNCI